MQRGLRVVVLQDPAEQACEATAGGKTTRLRAGSKGTLEETVSL